MTLNNRTLIKIVMFILLGIILSFIFKGIAMFVLGLIVMFFEVRYRLSDKLLDKFMKGTEE